MADVVPDQQVLSGHESEAVEVQQGPAGVDRSLIGCAGWRHRKRSMAESARQMHRPGDSTNVSERCGD
jgi:hypothetical protein